MTAWYEALPMLHSSPPLMTACEERVDFLAVTAMAKPDFRTIAKFRRRHLKALGDLFVQVLRLCQAAGLVRLGHVALDGTKIQANASLHKAMSYGRMRESERLAAVGCEPYKGSAAQLSELVREDLARWQKVVKDTGATLD